MGVGGIKAGNAYVSIGSDDSQLVKGLRGLESQFKAFGSQISGVGQTLTGLGGAVTAVGAAGLAGLGWPLNLASEMETAEAQFTTMLKDAGEAKRLLGDLQQFAAETPFQFPELADAGRKLLAFGSSSKDVKAELRTLGDIAAGIGAPIGEIAEIYGKARVQGRLFAEDINQLTGRGIPVIQELAKQFGVSDSEVKKLVEDGQIGFAQLEKAFKDLTSEQGQFGGGMRALSETMPGQLSTLKDNIVAAFRPFGEALLPAAKAAVGAVAGIVNQFSKWATANKQIVLPIAAALAGVTALGGVATAAGVALVGVGSAFAAIGTIAGTVSTVIGIIGAPIIGTIAAWGAGLAAVAGGFAFVAHQAGFLQPIVEWISGGFGTLWKTASQALGGITSALASGDFGKAASIAWAGVQVAFLKGTQYVLRGVEYLWDNAGALTQRFYNGLMSVTVRTFQALPDLIMAAMRGGFALQQAMQGVFAGIFNSKLDLAGQLDPAIAGAQARLDQLTLQVPVEPVPAAMAPAEPMALPQALPAFTPAGNPTAPAAPPVSAISGMSVDDRMAYEQAAHFAQMTGHPMPELPQVDMAALEPPQQPSVASGGGFTGMNAAELLEETNSLLRQLVEMGGLD